VTFTSQQGATSLELVADGGEGDDLARSGPRLLGADLVVAKFGEALRGCLLWRASSAVEALRALVAGKLRDVEFEGGGRRGGAVVADSDQLAAGIKQRDGGLERGNVVG
jgi:hypothetical protein